MGDYKCSLLLELQNPSGLLEFGNKPEGHMPDDPFIIADKVILDNRRDNRFQDSWQRWIIGLVLLAVSLAWMIFRTDLTREPNLPNRPLTKADLPLLKQKLKFLKADADKVSMVFPHLKNKAENQIANQAWEELYYTPEIFPAAAELRRIQFARVLELRPDLAEHVRVKQEYEEGRYEIANNPAITDKTAAIAALEKRLGPDVKGREYSKSAAQAMSVLSDLIGDPELDRAEREYKSACQTATLKRHPELAEYFHEMESRDAAYNHFMAQANALTRQIKALETGTEPAQPAAAKSEAPTTVTVSKTADAGNVNVPTSSPDSAAGQPAAATPAPPALPESAARYGIKVGDVVEISASKPMIALRHATITDMDNEQLTVRAGNDSYDVRWDDLTKLKASDKNNSGTKQ